MTKNQSTNLKDSYFERSKKKGSYKNSLAIPKISKVVINVGIGRLMAGSKNEELIKKISKDIAMITGQQPAIRPAKKSIASFKIREGMPVGLMVTLRGKRKDDFVYKFINIVLPQVRDFWGIAFKNVDQTGNLNYGIKDHAVFPEISREQNPLPFGLEVTFVPSTKKREEAIQLYESLGFPFQKNQQK
ncbi:MAG: large ribosomal subunit protein uL5 [Minisyncoccia bacterium]